MTGRFVCLCEDAQDNILAAKQSLWLRRLLTVKLVLTFFPFTGPPKIKCVGWISGKGV